MFSTIFSTSAPVDPKAPTFHPISSNVGPSDLFGELEPRDTEWLCAGGFATETQIFYHVLEDGSFFICQVIHSAIGLWYPSIQITFKIYNPNTKELVWKSVNVTNFVPGPPGLDKRSCKSDQFSITLKPSEPDAPESYIIRANLADDLQFSLNVSRPAGVPGYKVGKGPKGGYSYFGPDLENPEGYAIHRFWPHTIVDGHIISKGQAITAKGPGMMVHAIQGMRPNLLAAKWNFANFQSVEHGGVSAVQMDFTTIDAYGRTGAGSGGVVASVGSLVVGGKLVAVTAETKWPDEEQSEKAGVISRAKHMDAVMDAETGYAVPSEIEYRWAGPSIVKDVQGTIDATIKVNVGPPTAPKGLVEKVDVLGEIPYVIKTVVNYVASTKPYVYQWLNPAKLTIKGPDGILSGLSDGLDINGTLYNEATFIS